MIEELRAEVISVNWRRGSPGKFLRLRYDAHPEEEVCFEVSRAACVTKGDTVYSEHILSSSSSAFNDALYVDCKNGVAQIAPFFQVASTLKIGSISIPITIKEITDLNEFEGYKALTRFHYREKTLFGRHSALIATSDHPMLPNVLGYIDLATAFYVNGPRRRLLDAEVQLNGVGWNGWTAETIKSHIPLFVRIARCVVHPELRSSGLGTLLIQNAAQFAKTHWQSANHKPYFLEISADMLRFIPFAEKAGMTYVGDTEGNLNRIVKDLRYLKANENRVQKEIFKGEVCGILDTKLSQLEKANSIIGDDNQNISDVIAQQLKNPTLDGWAELSSILSLPKPHYIMGLNNDSEKLIAQRVQQLDIPQTSTSMPNKLNYAVQVYNSCLNESIRIEGISYQTKISVDRTEITHEIERAFEISLDQLEQPIFNNLSFEVQPGEIWVITGLSGTGKTTLLDLLSNKLVPDTGKIVTPQNLKIGKLKSISVNKPLIEVIGKNNTGQGIYWMGIVGLSEPHLYVKPFSALSAGQKYRAMLARLLIKGSNTWLIDEFCANLDVVNTNLISQKLSSLARQVGATVIVASADASRFVKALQPDKVLILRGPANKTDFEIIDGECCSEYFGV